MQRYYDDGNPTCKPCHYTCLTCSGGANTNCLSCNSSEFRTRNSGASTCPCNKYYFNNLMDRDCKRCHYSCLTCSNEYSCLTCNASMFR